ncbi:MAG TPA: alpha/beta hydrolase [Candidatus Limnocylindria bacterium]|nr:alpha/beta hydrolase [Candidatus Limnocylindria bacterium]
MSSVALATHEWVDDNRVGGAPVVLLIHGVTGWWKTWWRVGPALADRGWRVVAVDLRGHGHSPRFDGPATIADLAQDVAAVIEASAPRADLLVGHSLGGAVSVELAIRRPDLVERLVLEDPPANSRAGDGAWLEKLDREMRAAATSPDAEFARQRAENPDWLDEDVRQDVEGRALADREGILAFMARPNGSRVPDLVRQLPMPTLHLLAAGDGRSVYAGDARRRLVEELPPHARLVEFDCGHVLHRDRYERYVGTILEWTDRA